jgi:hypothetical protein
VEVLEVMHRKLAWLTAGFAFCLLAFVPGCGPKDDLKKARSVVETALESWKKAEKSKDLTSRGVEIQDEDWDAGQKLLDFNIKSVASMPQQGPRAVVTLNLQSKAGKKKDKEVAYEVILNDKTMSKIRRDPFHVP